MSEPTKSYTGRARKRKTSPAIKLMDLLSQSVITVGGIGTIVAVSMVGLFLVWVVAPLFLPPRWE
ncbi:MAG TPA: hypothetical protein DEW46_15410, partial [Verrucomicrobia bacterium]|nr:hypothetical protein [Verrucomicrobiota bacterium]